MTLTVVNAVFGLFLDSLGRSLRLCGGATGVIASVIISTVFSEVYSE